MEKKIKKYPVIDGHMHIMQWFRSDGKTTFEMIREYEEKCGIAAVDNMACTSDGVLYAGYEEDQTILGQISKLEDPRVFNHGCLLIPDDPGFNEKHRFCDQLEELMELGLDGIKICDFKPNAYVRLNVEKRLSDYEDFITACEKNGVHMCWHVADPDYFWDENKISDKLKSYGWFYGDGTYPSFDELIGFAVRMIETHPKLNVQLAHAFFKSEKPDEIENLLKNNPNVTIDLAPGGEMFDGFRAFYGDWYRIFREYSDRFLFATDAASTYPDHLLSSLSGGVYRFLSTTDTFDITAINVAHGIGLEGEALENVLFRNHERTVGKTPVPVNKTALKKYIAKYLPMMRDTKNKAMIEEYYRKNLL